MYCLNNQFKNWLRLAEALFLKENYINGDIYL